MAFLVTEIRPVANNTVGMPMPQRRRPLVGATR
jgi:hypothetical protein